MVFDATQPIVAEVNPRPVVGNPLSQIESAITDLRLSGSRVFWSDGATSFYTYDIATPAQPAIELSDPTTLEVDWRLANDFVVWRRCPTFQTSASGKRTCDPVSTPTIEVFDGRRAFVPGSNPSTLVANARDVKRLAVGPIGVAWTTATEPGSESHMLSYWNPAEPLVPDVNPALVRLGVYIYEVDVEPEGLVYLLGDLAPDWAGPRVELIEAMRLLLGTRVHAQED